ncbi:MAG TPA: hypothetical protein VHY20_03670 [Pirellulales bacterium]|nr:hypothetical protein [Pirellulales bacterium]
MKNSRCMNIGQKLIALLGLLAVLTALPTKAAEPPAGPITKGLRIFTCGHSFHVWVAPLLDEIAKSAGLQEHQLAGVSGIGGSQVIQHLETVDDKHQAKAALTAGNLDVLTLSPIWLPDEGIDQFAELGLQHNPRIRITIQENWLPNDTYEPKYPLDVKKQVNHNATDLSELRTKNAQYCHDIEAYCGAINKRLGKDVLLVVPVGEASIALREKIVAGQAPGLKKQWDLFRDNWGHAQAALQVLDGYCHFAVIYRRSPVGLPVPEMLAKYRRITGDVEYRKLGWRPSAEDLARGEALTAEQTEQLNRLLQELAWQTVTHHPMTGLDASSPAQ